MTQGQIENYILQLGNVELALGSVEVKGENNLNLLLASIQAVRGIRNSLKESEKHDNHDKQGPDVQREMGLENYG